MSSASSYDAIAEFYDDDMGRNTNGEDVVYYCKACLAAGAGAEAVVLELGCGTGRISLALADIGVQVVGIDRSVPMLQVLQRKVAARRAEGAILRPPILAAMDMARPALSGRFAAVLCPYSAFTYLLADADRAAALEFVRNVLAPRGRFVVDVFVPDLRVEHREDAAEIFDYRRKLPDGTWLERRKTVTPDVRPGINRIVRRYTFLDADGTRRRELVTESHQRPCGLSDLLQVVRAAGLCIVSATADFAGLEVGPQSRVIVVEAEPEAGGPAILRSRR